ncbi:MAG: hypothetical protein WCD54_26805, partial [Pseudolabrys sp.]
MELFSIQLCHGNLLHTPIKCMTERHKFGLNNGSAGMSALGQKPAICDAGTMSALPPKADMCSALTHVRFVPKADIGY